MDTGLNIRPVQPVSIAPVRMSPPVERQTAASDLPETQAVTAAAEDAPVRLQQGSQARELRANLNSAFDREAEIVAKTLNKVVQDETTKELIYRKISATTGQVVNQYPEEAVLRMKAYNAQQEKLAETASARQVLA
jgi:flagellar protein FlaG